MQIAFNDPVAGAFIWRPTEIIADAHKKNTDRINETVGVMGDTLEKFQLDEITDGFRRLAMLNTLFIANGAIGRVQAAKFKLGLYKLGMEIGNLGESLRKLPPEELLAAGSKVFEEVGKALGENSAEPDSESKGSEDSRTA